MSAGLVVRGRMTAGRAVAAADVTARLAHPQVHPPAAGGQALLAAGDLRRQLKQLDLIDVAARGHEIQCKAIGTLSAGIRDGLSANPASLARLGVDDHFGEVGEPLAQLLLELAREPMCLDERLAGIDAEREEQHASPVGREQLDLLE